MSNWKTAMVAGAAALGSVLAGPALAQDISANPTYGDINLEAGFAPDPYSVEIAAGGSIDAQQSVSDACRGTVASAPDVNLTYSAGSFPLYISVTSDADTTLVINAPDGTWHCNDDYSGFDPAVTFSNPGSGLYNIWVGTYSSSAGLPDAMVHVSELEVTSEATMGGFSGGGLDYTLPPTYGSASLSAGFLPDPHSVALQAGGTIDANAVVNSSCRGYVAEAPDYSVDYEAGSLSLYFIGRSDSDTTMVINAPDGSWHCDDDGADRPLDPQIVFENPQSGRYDVWIGTYSSSGEFPDATLSVSELGRVADAAPTGKTPPAGLDYSLPATYGTASLSAGFLPDPHTVTLQAGGTIEARTAVNDTCRGYVAEAPDYSVDYSAGDFPLYFIGTSDRDTTLVINAPDGSWHCDDDGADRPLDPQIVFQAPQSGRYDVWVGTYSSSGDYPETTLSVSELGTSAGASDIVWSGEPSYGEVSLSGGFSPDPYVVSMSAGGSQDASALGNNCRGWVAGNPDFNLNYTADSWPLYISASASTDTTIVVNAPDGSWHCGDDYSGLNPAVEFQSPQSGLYNVWVGTYSDTPDLPPATLFISELEAQF